MLSGVLLGFLAFLNIETNVYLFGRTSGKVFDEFKIAPSQNAKHSEKSANAHRRYMLMKNLQKIADLAKLSDQENAAFRTIVSFRKIRKIEGGSVWHTGPFERG